MVAPQFPPSFTFGSHLLSQVGTRWKGSLLGHRPLKDAANPKCPPYPGKAEKSKGDFILPSEAVSLASSKLLITGAPAGKDTNMETKSASPHPI